MKIKDIKVLDIRPYPHPDDSHLLLVLAEHPTKMEWVVWMWNKEFDSLNYGKYFTELKDARWAFENKYTELCSHDKFFLSVVYDDDNKPYVVSVEKGAKDAWDRAYEMAVGHFGIREWGRYQVYGGYDTVWEAREKQNTILAKRSDN